MNLQQIGRKISELRRERDMTQNELADKAGVSYQAVSSWERGLTMPDIAKLPGISQVLGVSIDDLLDNQKEVDIIKDVLTQNTAVYAGEKELHFDEVAEVAPMLKPSQIDDLVQHVEVKEGGIDMHSLISLAPFTSREVLGQIADKAVVEWDLETLTAIAPFLSRDYLGQLVDKVEIEEIGYEMLLGLAPFLSRDKLGEVAKKYTDEWNIDKLVGIAPFLSRNDLDNLCEQLNQSEGMEIGALIGLAPFLSRGMVDKLALRAAGGQ